MTPYLSEYSNHPLLRHSILLVLVLPENNIPPICVLPFVSYSAGFKKHSRPPDTNTMTTSPLEAIASSSGKKHPMHLHLGKVRRGDVSLTALFDTEGH